MITILKKGISEQQSREASNKVREVVEDILQGITDQGDAHVREMSAKLDNWSPPSFRLSDDEIQACIDSLPESTLHDIKVCPGAGEKFCTHTTRFYEKC